MIELQTSLCLQLVKVLNRVVLLCAFNIQETSAPKSLLESLKGLTPTWGNGQMIQKKAMYRRHHMEEPASSGATTSQICLWPILNDQQIKMTTLISS